MATVLRELHDVLNAALPRHFHKRDLLLLCAFRGVGQQERALHARASSPHRVRIVKITLHELNVRRFLPVQFSQIARDRADLLSAVGQAFEDFSPHCACCSSNQDHIELG